jgi:protein arginine N-methyltransferase 1
MLARVTVYSVRGYGAMIADRTRVAAYTEALRRAIRPGCTVLDIGTGTGFFAMLACRLGAGKVYAIEPDDIIDLAREAARANGYAGRIEFIQDLSTRIELPQAVDIIVSDLRTVLPWYQQHIATIVDARERLLKPGGILIPEQDTLWAAVVDMPEFHAQFVGHQPRDTAGFDMSAARRAGANAWAKARAKPDQLLTTPRQWARLDYRHVTEPNVDARISWTADRSGHAHGVIAWFDTILSEDVGFSNGPDSEPALYGNAFFTWPEAVEITAGDTISVSLHGNLVNDEYIWRWNSRVAGGDKPKAVFTQSNYTGPPGLASLALRSASHKPVLEGHAEIDRFILGLMGHGSTSRHIAEIVAGRFPGEFATWQDALVAVGDLSVRYSR